MINHHIDTLKKQRSHQQHHCFSVLFLFFLTFLLASCFYRRLPSVFCIGLLLLFWIFVHSFGYSSLLDALDSTAIGFIYRALFMAFKYTKV